MDSELWSEESVTGKSGGEVERYKLPDSRKAKLSLSGSETNSFFAKSPDGKYQDVSALTGLDSTSDSRCIAAIDFDRDGFRDFLVTNTNDATLNVYQNRSAKSKNGFVAVKVVGGNVTNEKATEYSNRDAIGTKIFVHYDGKKTLTEVRCGEGLATQDGAMHLVGIGNHNTVDLIEVVFPSGKRHRTAGVASGTLVCFYEDASMSPDDSGIQVTEYFPEQRIGQRDSIAHVKDLPKALQFESTIAPLRIVLSMATWCEKCQAKIEETAWIKKQFADRVEVIAVPVDLKDSQKKLDAYIDKFQPEYTLLKKDLMRSLALLDLIKTELGDASIPNSIVLSPNNKILEVMHGMPTVSDLRHIAARHGIRLD